MKCLVKTIHNQKTKINLIAVNSSITKIKSLFKLLFVGKITFTMKIKKCENTQITIEITKDIELL